MDRLAASPSQDEEAPLNDLPDADGNSPDFVVAEDPSIGVDSVVEPGESWRCPRRPSRSRSRVWTTVLRTRPSQSRT